MQSMRVLTLVSLAVTRLKTIASYVKPCTSKADTTPYHGMRRGSVFICVNREIVVCSFPECKRFEAGVALLCREYEFPSRFLLSCCPNYVYLEVFRYDSVGVGQG